MPPRGKISIESENLETHVELCAERYQNLEKRLENMEEKLEKLSELVVSMKTDFQDALAKTNTNFNNRLIAVAGSTIGILVTALIGFLLSKA